METILAQKDVSCWPVDKEFECIAQSLYTNLWMRNFLHPMSFQFYIVSSQSRNIFFSSALLFPILIWSQLVAMRKIWWNTPEITLAPNRSPGSQMLHHRAAVWCGTDKKVWLLSSHILTRGHCANVKTIHRWAETLRLISCLVPAEMWCFCVLSAFGCSSVPFQWTWTEFLIWHLCQERALSLNKDQGVPLKWESSGYFLQRNCLLSAQWVLTVSTFF